MNFQKRKRFIFQELEKKGELGIQQLADALQTSTITVRRDLNLLAADGLLLRTHGGAMKVGADEFPHRFNNKAAVHAKAKEQICRIAAGQIADGDIIFMDCGSTVFHLCQFIKNKKIKVITNSLPVISALQESQVSLNIIGGEFDAERQAIHGKKATDHIASYRATKAFVGVDGISDRGLFSHSEKEASITLAMAAQSAFTYLLCDESKIGKESYLKFAKPELVNAIITDCPATKLKQLKKRKIAIIHTK